MYLGTSISPFTTHCIFGKNTVNSRNPVSGSINSQRYPSCWMNALSCSFRICFQKCWHTSAVLAPPLPPQETKTELAQQTEATVSTCAGWCSIANPSFWSRENTTVTAREAWWVCFPPPHAHLPYRMPYKLQKPAMTPTLPSAAKIHMPLSKIRTLIYICPCYYPYFSWSILHSQPALPLLLFGFPSRVVNLWS